MTHFVFLSHPRTCSASQYIHRDIEPKHLGMAPDGSLCLIDMGSCAPLSWPMSDQASQPEPASGRTGHIMEASTQCYYSGRWATWSFGSMNSLFGSMNSNKESGGLGHVCSYVRPWTDVITHPSKALYFTPPRMFSMLCFLRWQDVYLMSGRTW